MKKIIALFIASSLLFLCACSDKSESDDTTTAATDVAVTESVDSSAKSDIEYASEWGSDILPENFPSPPEKAHDITVETGKANKTYSSDWIRIEFTCPLNELYRFTNKLTTNGYIGGIKEINSPASYYRAGINGNWQDGEHLLRIAAAEKNESDEITIVLDITACKDNFPETLTTIFPKFNGFSKNSGLYSEYDENGDKITNDFIGNLYANSWTWDFGFENAFIGVTEEEVEAYTNELFNAQFAGVSSTNVVDGCSVICYDLVKETSDKTYGVFIAYNQIMKTMDILYTNNISLIVGA